MNKKRILIFDTEVTGHHIEYLHHLLIKARSSQDDYIFCLSEDFIEAKGTEFDWSYGDNVVFKYVNTVKANEEVSMLKKAYRKCKLLHSVIMSCDVTHVFLVSLITFIPFLPLFVPSKIRVSGIIYNIYLYRWKNSSILLRTLDVLKYIILSYSKCINSVYILNDEASTRILNMIYKTKKYRFLVDPYIPLKDSCVSLDSLNIKVGNTVYFHFGSLSERKGTLEILKAIKLIEREYLSRITFIFAGKIQRSIQDEFYRLYREIHISKSCQIIIIDKFCDYELIGKLCKQSDILLMPYKIVSQSSGVIGYAAQYNTPVLAPAKGLIGKLVKKYMLGYLIDKVTPYDIATFIIKGPDKTKKVSTEYLDVNTVDNFINSIRF